MLAALVFAAVAGVAGLGLIGCAATLGGSLAGIIGALLMNTPALLSAPVKLPALTDHSHGHLPQ